MCAAQAPPLELLIPALRRGWVSQPHQRPTMQVDCTVRPSGARCRQLQLTRVEKM